MITSATTTPQLRAGYTTGICATACTRAALLAWLTQQRQTSVTVSLPDGETVEFPLDSCRIETDGAICTVRKNAGADPDVTHQAIIGCRVTWRLEPTIVFRRGEGVGIVTLPGLPVPVGEPAINPVPRRMMTTVVRNTLAAHGRSGGAEIEVFVRGGAEIATKTINYRLGVVGGISIIGTTGRVRPFSSEAYIASISSALDVAAATGCSRVVLNSGGHTESMLRTQFFDLSPQAFIQYGNWIGKTLERLRATPIRTATIGLMLGKAAKLAVGHLDTHSQRSTWDRAFVAGLARECGYHEPIVAAISSLILARQLGELVPFSANEPLYHTLCARCHAICQPLIPDIPLEIRLHNDGSGWLIHADGKTRAANQDSDNRIGFSTHEPHPHTRRCR